MRIFFALVFLLYPTAAWTQETPPPVDCSSISSILANPDICDKRPVRLAGKVNRVKHLKSEQGNPYTQFTLADGSKQLDFFSFDHLPLKMGICVQVEGTYYTRRQVGTSFKKEVIVEKKAEGIAPAPCPPERKKVKGKSKAKEVPVTLPSGDEKVEEKQKAKEVPPASYLPVWSRSEIISVGILILIVLAIVVNKILTPARYYRMGRDFEEYVIGLFPDTDWEIEDRSSDTSKRIGRRVTGDASYDCIMKHRRTSKRFIVQCKYRSRFFRKDNQDGIEWAKPYQIRNYRNFQREKGWPYVGIIGVGGRPRHPKHLFVLPLEYLHDTFIRKAGLEIAGRDPHRPFTVDDQGLLG